MKATLICTNAVEFCFFFLYVTSSNCDVSTIYTNSISFAKIQLLLLFVVDLWDGLGELIKS